MSGPGGLAELETAKNVVHETLSPFSLAIEDVQSINMADRIILAMQIACDEAHLSAIEKDLKMKCAALNLDVAAELL